MTRFVTLVLRFRFPILGLCLALTVGAAAMLGTAHIGSSLGKLFFGESPKFDRYLERVEEFASDDVVIVVIEDVDVLGPETLGRLDAAAEQIEGLEDVKTVLGVHSAQHVDWRGGTLHSEPYAEEARDEPERRAEILRALQADPLTGGILVSRDGRHAALVVELEADKNRPAERGSLLVGAVIDALVAAGFARDALRSVGFQAVMGSLMDATHDGIERIFPYTIVVLFLVVFLLFRRFWPALIALGVALIGVTWTMALAIAFDPEINVLMSMVPIVILIVAFSDVIHLCSAYLIELSHGHPKREAIACSAADVGRACIYTSLTTLVGFLAMTFVPVPVFRLLGVILGFGVAVSLLLAVTLVPILFSLMREPRPWRRGAASAAQRGVDLVIARMALLTTRHPWLVISAFAALVAVSLLGLGDLEIETKWTERLAENSPARQNTAYFQKHFVSDYSVDLFVQLPEGDAPLLEPAAFARLVAYQDAIAAYPGVASAQSLVDLVRVIHRELNEDIPSAGALPETRPALAQYLLLFEMSGGEGLGRMIDFDRRTARISVRLEREGVRFASETGDALAAMGDRMLGADATVEPSGMLYLIGDWLDELVTGQKRGLLFSVVTIALMMMLALRSWRVGLASMIPNLLPLLVLGGWLGAAYDSVDSDHIVIGMLAIGIGVDDTIHFLTRYRLEAARTDDRGDALRRTFDFAGRAIIMTTVTLALGLAPMASGGYLTFVMLGTLLPATLVVALMADLLLVPALVEVGLLSCPQGQAERKSGQSE